MLCPACKDCWLLAVELNQVEVDYCPECGGLWLDSGELEIVAKQECSPYEQLLVRAVAFPRARQQTGARRCPICRRRMVETQVPCEPPVVVDRCPQGDGLWLDYDELSALLKTAKAEKEAFHPGGLLQLLSELKPPT